jgi:hypothetical protein
MVQEAAVNVPAVDALHAIGRQLNVIRLAVNGLDADEQDKESIVCALDDVADRVSALSEARRLRALAVVR